MKSISKIKKQSDRKTKPELVQTINEARRKKGWLAIAGALSGSTRKLRSINLFEIDRETSAGDTVIIPGKILSKGELSKKIRICALSFSEKAREKLKESKSESVSILEEIKKNPKAEGVRILR